MALFAQNLYCSVLKRYYLTFPIYTLITHLHSTTHCDIVKQRVECAKSVFAYAESFNKQKPAIPAKNNFCLPPPALVPACFRQGSSYLCTYKALFAFYILIFNILSHTLLAL
jgi:hypothetical protein